MLEQRQSLIEERRKAAADTKRQKEAIAKVMEEVRTNASKANKLISQALTGKLSFSDLTGGGNGGGKKRSKSAGDTSMSKNKTSSDLLGLDRRNQSAGDDEFNADINASQHQFHPSVVESGNAKPYISPYDSVA